MGSRVLWACWIVLMVLSKTDETTDLLIYSEWPGPCNETSVYIQTGKKGTISVQITALHRLPTVPPYALKHACSSTGCAWCCTKDVVLELFLFSKYLTTLKCQIELLAIWLYADVDSSFSIERVGAFRSVKGLGPTIEIKKKKNIWNKIKLWSFLTTHLSNVC